MDEKQIKKKHKEKNFDLLRELTKTGSNKKAEVLKNIDEILEAISKGYDQKTIWKTLKENNRVSCSYHYFLVVISRYNQKKKSTPKKRAVVKAPPAKAGGAFTYSR